MTFEYFIGKIRRWINDELAASTSTAEEPFTDAANVAEGFTSRLLKQPPHKAKKGTQASLHTVKRHSGFYSKSKRHDAAHTARSSN